MKTLKTKIDFLAKNIDIKISQKVEHKLVLLNRLIEISEDYKSKWGNPSNETEYEKLGQVYFLEQGLWSAKVRGPKQESDLIFWEHILDQNEVSSAGGYIILTEWKIADKDNYIGQIEAAKSQLERYKAGIVYGLGLENIRYIILVSKKHLPIKGTEKVILEGSVRYEIKNIITDPDNASKQAKMGKA